MKPTKPVRRATLTGVAPPRGACAPSRPGLVASSRYRLAAVERYVERIVIPRTRVVA